MPTWGGILEELSQLKLQGNQVPFDMVRRKYLVSLQQYTGRNVIIYASKWTRPQQLSPDAISITDEDVQGFMEVFHGLKGDTLDLIVHSPGGFAESTEAIVSYLRAKFKDVRVIIPYAAMSAATMLACAADKIVMGKHSFIGPIDPQMGIVT
jgi:ClpP class serine protease